MPIVRIIVPAMILVIVTAMPVVVVIVIPAMVVTLDVDEFHLAGGTVSANHASSAEPRYRTHSQAQTPRRNPAPK
jgi:hypothetical protein